MEADVVFLIGDHLAVNSSWHRNQLFKLAGVFAGGDMTPGDTVLEHEAMKPVALGMTRARSRCYWMTAAGGNSPRTASNLVTISAEVFNDARNLAV